MELDEFCGTFWGVSKNWEVLSISGQLKGNKGKTYFVKCHICAQDEELHGDGIFSSSKYKIVNSVLFCGCSNSHKWTEVQWILRVKRKCEGLNFRFLGWFGEYNRAKGRMLLECKNHGIVENIVVGDFMRRRLGCRLCLSEAATIWKTRPEEEIAKELSALGTYPPGTVFSKSDRHPNPLNYFKIWCPVCKATAEQTTSTIRLGIVSCSCRRQDQTQCYINLIKDGDILLALKIGISYDYRVRMKSQQNKTIFKVENFGVWGFPNNEITRNVEKICLKTFKGGVISKEMLPDGHTETISPYDLDKLIDIYEKNGGIRLND